MDLKVVGSSPITHPPKPLQDNYFWLGQFRANLFGQFFGQIGTASGRVARGFSLLSCLFLNLCSLSFVAGRVCLPDLASDVATAAPQAVGLLSIFHTPESQRTFPATRQGWEKRELLILKQGGDLASGAGPDGTSPRRFLKAISLFSTL